MFPATRHSAVLGTRSADPAERNRAWETLIAAYWKPVYKYTRLQWQASAEDAQDLTQAFFARALEKGYFDSYDPGRSRFRTFLRVCLEGFLANEHKAALRQKRGGEVLFVPLDFEGAEGELRQQEIPDGVTTEELFRREWVRSLFGMAVDQLRAECEARGRQVHFHLFERYDLEESGLSYDDLAVQFGIPITSVTNYLAVARREFRRIVLDRIREISGSEEEFRAEARAVLGVDPA